MTDEHDGGLAHDLEVMQRRRFLRWVIGVAGAAVVPSLGCGVETRVGEVDDTSGTDAAASTGSGTCADIPEETAGPYPGDGSNGVNALTQSGIVRSDITTSFGSYSGTAEGIPLTIRLKLVDVGASCAALEGYAIYLWHCDRDGNYSLYTAKTQNYLRGVQETAADGTVTFESIFPACYSGRWPHIHFEVYPSLDGATSSTNKLATSQMAIPKTPCDAVYATDGYASSITNLARVTLASDNVFSDGATLETPTVSGSVSAGYVLDLTVGIQA